MPLNGTAGAGSIRPYGFSGKTKSFFTQSYTTPGNFSWTPPNGTANAEVLVVGGGGPGGSGFDRTGGAGGGGGLIYYASYPVTPGSSIPITVGAGGTVTGLTIPSSGGNSVFGSLTAIGGGYGGASAFPLGFLAIAGSTYNRQLTNVAFTASGTTITATIPSQLTYTGVTFTYNSLTKMVTGTTSATHGLLFGNQIIVSGTTATTNAPNGTWIVNSVPTATTFTFHISNGLEPTGSIGNGTVQTPSAHGLSVGQQFTVSGTTASTNPPNNVQTDFSTNVLGTYYTIASVPASNTFTFTALAAPTGTITNGIVGLPECTFITASSRATGTASAHNFAVGNYANIMGPSSTGLNNLPSRTNQRLFYNSSFDHTRLYGCSFSYSGDIITVTTPSAHGFSVGSTFTVYNTTATTNPPNESGTVLSVVSPTQFTFQATSIPTGTITNGDVMGCLITVTTTSAHGVIEGGGFASSINIASTTSVLNPPIYQTVVASVPSSTTLTFNTPVAPYNPRFTGATFSYSGTTVTVTTASAHGLAVNSMVEISGVTASTNAPNGTFYIATVPTATTFTYTALSVPTGTLSTGTVTERIGNTSAATVSLFAPSYQYYFRIPYQITAIPTSTSFKINCNPAPTGTITSGSLGIPPSNGGSAGSGGHNQSGKNGTITTGTAGQGNASGDGYDSSFGIFTSGGGGGAGGSGGDGSDQGGGAGGIGLQYFGTTYGSGGGGSVQTLMSSGSIKTTSAMSWTGSTITATYADAHGLSVGSVIRVANCSMANVAVSSASYSGTTITLNTSTAHGYTVGDTIYPYAFTASTNAPNGTYTVSSVPNATSLTYIVSSAPTGTLVVGQLLQSGKYHPSGNYTVTSVPTTTTLTFANTGGLTPIGNAMNACTTYGRFTGIAPTFTYSGTKITVTCPVAHNLQYAGQSIRVHNVSATTNAPNGSFRVSRIISSTVFQYIVSSAPTGTLSGGFWETPATYTHVFGNTETTTGALLPGTITSGGGAGAVSFPLDGTYTSFNGGNGTGGTGGGGGAPAYQYADSNAVIPLGGQGGSGAVIVRYYAWS